MASSPLFRPHAPPSPPGAHFVRLSLRGVGFRVWHFRRHLLLELGFSHLFFYRLPPSLVALPSRGQLLLASLSRPLLHLVAAQLTALRPPDPYRGKGVHSPLRRSLPKRRSKDGA